MAELKTLDQMARRYADATAELDDEVKALQRAVEDLKRIRLRKIATLVGRASQAEVQLRAAIDESRELFESPKTMNLHGVKFGLQKAKDTLDWLDDAALIKRIRAKYSSIAGTLIKTEEKPVVAALQQLNDKQLKGLGIKKIPGTDQILISLTEGDIEKAVTKMVDTSVNAGLKEAGR